MKNIEELAPIAEEDKKINKDTNPILEKESPEQNQPGEILISEMPECLTEPNQDTNENNTRLSKMKGDEAEAIYQQRMQKLAANLNTKATEGSLFHSHRTQSSPSKSNDPIQKHNEDKGDEPNTNRTPINQSPAKTSENFNKKLGEKTTFSANTPVIIPIDMDTFQETETLNENHTEEMSLIQDLRNLDSTLEIKKKKSIERRKQPSVPISIQVKDPIYPMKEYRMGNFTYRPIQENIPATNLVIADTRRSNYSRISKQTENLPNNPDDKKKYNDKINISNIYDRTQKWLKEK